MNPINNIKNKSLKRQDSEKDTKTPPEISLDDLTKIINKTPISHKKDLIRDTIYAFCISKNLPISKLNIENHFLELKNEDGSQRFSTSSSKSKTKTYLLKNSIFETEPPYFFNDEFVLAFEAELIEIFKQKKNRKEYLEAYKKALDTERFQKIEKTEKLKDIIKNFIGEDEIKKDIIHQIYDNPDSISGRCEVFIDFEKLELFNQTVADAFWEHPDAILTYFTETLNKIGFEVFNEKPKIINERVDDTPEMIPVEITPRFSNIPSYNKKNLSTLSSKDLYHLVCINVTIMRVTQKHHKINKAKFVCNKCGHEIIVPQPLTKINLTTPPQCPSCDRRDFRDVPEESEVVDCRFARLQDALDEMGGGEPESIEAWFTGNLANDIAPGNSMTIFAIPKIKPTKKSTSALLDRYLDVVSVVFHDSTIEELSDEDKEIVKTFEGDKNLFEKEVNSIAPNVNGHEKLKEILVCYCFGGSSNLKDASRNRIRNAIHVNLIGDPGVSKTILAESLRKVLPSVTYIVGTDTTAAGLTAAVKEDKTLGGHVLEAGAIVKSDRTIIDEFNNFKNDELLELNTPMASGELFINKAGITARYKINTGILAIANPKKEKFDQYSDIPPQIDCPRTLLSRFDIIPIIFKESDNKKRQSTRDLILNPLCDDYKTNITEPEIDTETFKKLIIYAQSINPKLSKAAHDEIRKYTNKLIEMEGENSICFVERQIYPLVRLTTARARAKLKNIATKEDAIATINLFDYFLRKIATDREGNFDFNKIYGDGMETRKKMQVIEKTIKDLSTPENQYLAPIDEILKITGIPKTEFNELVIEMKKKGTIMESKPGQFKLNQY